MKSLFILIAILLLNTSGYSQLKYYLIPNSGHPWNSSSNTTAMNTAFGNGNWTQGNFETISVNALFQPSVCFIFIDGSNQGSAAFINFLNANTSSLENWVNAGGRLFLNCAPNGTAITNINMGFSVTLTYSAGPYSSAATAAPGMSNHPIFSGPATPTSNLTGNYVSHGYFAANSTTPVITATVGTILSELNYGAGKVFFGAMTTSNYHAPNPEATNLRANMFSYVGNICGLVGMNELSANIDDFKILPNPNDGVFTISSDDVSEKSIEVFDPTGRRILSLKSEGTTEPVSLREHGPGIYLLRISTASYRRSHKLVIY